MSLPQPGKYLRKTVLWLDILTFKGFDVWQWKMGSCFDLYYQCGSSFHFWKTWRSSFSELTSSIVNHMVLNILVLFCFVYHFTLFKIAVITITKHHIGMLLHCYYDWIHTTTDSTLPSVLVLNTDSFHHTNRITINSGKQTWNMTCGQGRWASQNIRGVHYNSEFDEKVCLTKISGKSCHVY